MKNLLKKMSGASRTDRREALEQEAAEKIKAVGGRDAPPEAFSASWAASGAGSPAAPVGAPPAAGPAPAGRRLTVQERMAARQPQGG